MFGGSTFVSLGGAVKLAQPTYPPAPAATPAPAPAPAPAPVLVAPPTAPVVPVATAGLSHGTQVAIAAGILGLTLLGAIFLTD